jgi:hypothetical protein
MRQDPQFTAKLQDWMNTPDSQKDWAEGAILLLQLSGNQIMYRNISVNPKGKAEFIKGQLQKYLNFRLQQLTHDEVEEMQKKVDEIVVKVIKPDADNSKKSAEFADFKAGKRPDHDSLPEEIQALYAENLDLVHRMRETHMKLRSLSLEDATCPDSERYPYLKALIDYDKKLHENWDVYDHYVAGSEPTTTHDVEASEDDSTIVIPVEEGASKEATDTVAETTETVADAPEAEVKTTAKKTTRKATSKKTAAKKA